MTFPTNIIHIFKTYINPTPTNPIIQAILYALCLPNVITLPAVNDPIASPSIPEDPIKV